jgi:hypothetical protein
MDIFRDVAMWNFEIIFKRRSLCTCVMLAVVSDDLWRVGIEDAAVWNVILHHVVNGYILEGHSASMPEVRQHSSWTT